MAKKLIAIAFISVLLIGCKSADGLSKAQQTAQITEKVESQDYTFIPQTALPTRGKSISLNYSYYLKVRNDTVSVYLPFFGRAYTAPNPGESGGISFTSTDFEYTISEKKKGSWNAYIKINDDTKGYKLNLQIGDNGYSTLSVQDNTREPMSFYGRVE